MHSSIKFCGLIFCLLVWTGSDGGECCKRAQDDSGSNNGGGVVVVPPDNPGTNPDPNPNPGGGDAGEHDGGVVPPDLRVRMIDAVSVSTLDVELVRSFAPTLEAPLREELIGILNRQIAEVRDESETARLREILNLIQPLASELRATLTVGEVPRNATEVAGTRTGGRHGRTRTVLPSSIENSAGSSF